MKEEVSCIESQMRAFRHENELLGEINLQCSNESGGCPDERTVLQIRARNDLINRNNRLLAQLEEEKKKFEQALSQT